jgi:hypothetical protein
MEKRSKKTSFLTCLGCIKQYILNGKGIIEVQIKKTFKTGNTRVEYGCVDKENQQVVYVSMKLRVKPEYDDDWNSFIPSFKRKLLHRTKEIINKCDIFDNKFMLDVNTFTDRIMANKTSLFTLDVYLRQRDPVHNMEEIDNDIISVIYQIESVARELLEEIGL